MRASGDLGVTVDEPVSTVNIESPLRLLEDLLQQFYVIGSSCGEQPLICGFVVSRCVNSHTNSSIRDILLGAPSEAIFKEAKRTGWWRKVGDLRNRLSNGVDDLDQHM